MREKGDAITIVRRLYEGRRYVPYLLGAATLLAYAPGIWWGLPHATHAGGVHGWDTDSVTGMQTLSEFHNLLVSAKPDWWVAYPLFHYIVLGIFYTPYLIYLAITGGLSNMTSEYPYGLSDPVGFFIKLNLIGRFVTLGMAVGTVVSVYETAKTIWDESSGILSAVFFMLSTPMFYYSRTGNLDVPALFWMSLGLFIFARCLNTGFTLRRAALLGTFAALSVATKDQAGAPWLLGLTTLTVLYYRSDEINGGVIRSQRWKVPFVMLLSSVIAYVLASGLLINPGRFIAHIQFLRNFRQTFYNVANTDILRPNTPEGNLLLMSDVLEMLLLAVGPVILITGVLGLVITWRSSLFIRILLGMGIGFLLLVIWPIHHMQYRYTLFLVLIIALTAGRAMALGLNEGPFTKAVTVAAMVISLVWLGARGVDVTYQMLFDARIAAGRWLEQNHQPKDRLAYFGSADAVPALPAGMSSACLPSDLSAMDALKRKSIKYVLVAPDYSSEIGMSRSKFLNEAVHDALKDGMLGYNLVAVFETPPLFQWNSISFPLMKPSYINPTVQILCSTDSDPGDAGV